MKRILLVFVGGFCGTLARYLLSAPLLALARAINPGGVSIPVDILVINLAGAFALGLLYGGLKTSQGISADLRLALGTGFLGAFTTFSTYMAGSAHLLTSGATLAGLLYLGGGTLAGVLCARLGVVTGVLLAPVDAAPQPAPSALPHGTSRPSLAAMRWLPPTVDMGEHMGQASTDSQPQQRTSDEDSMPEEVIS